MSIPRPGSQPGWVPPAKRGGRRPRRVGGVPGQLTRIRNAWGLRVQDVVAITGVSDHTLRYIDRGQIDRVCLGSLARVAVALGVRPTDLVPALRAQPAVKTCAAAQLVKTRRELARKMTRSYGGDGLDRASARGRYAHGVPAGRMEVLGHPSYKPPPGPDAERPASEGDAGRDG